MEDLSKHKILYSPKEGTSGFRGLRNVPKYPEVGCNWLFKQTGCCPAGQCAAHKTIAEYEEALESCKSNSLEIVNPEVMGFDQTYFLPKSGDIFDLPEGYKLENGGYCEGCRRAGLYHCAHADTCGYAKDVLRLVKTETKENCFVCVFPDKFDIDGRKYCINCGAMAGEIPQPEPEESQYWLWDEVDNIFQANKSDEAMRICERKFTIQRKKQ